MRTPLTSGIFFAPNLYAYPIGSGFLPTELSFDFDANELGQLPRAIGFKINTAAQITANFFSLEGRLLDSIFAPIVPLDIDPPPSVLASLLDYVAQYRFLGAVEPDGIARVTIFTPSGGITLDDFQYGQQVSEPTSLYLLAVGYWLTLLRRARAR